MNKIICIFIAIIVIVFVFFTTQQKWIGQEEKQDLTINIALDLIQNHLIENDCKSEGVDELYRSCILDLEKIEENTWIITVIYDGFFDDSVRGSRLRAQAAFISDEWQIDGDIIEDFKCHQGRGHEDFSTELCV